MHQGLIEETHYPRNPLDVLAQQIVAMSAMDDWEINKLASVIRRSANFADLSDEVLGNVLDLLSGTYPSEEFSDLRPRIVYDRVAGVVRGRAGSQRLAVTNAGTIPDRGLFGVFLPDVTRVGELDEEMVYESRVGETFLLGASTWRIEDITFERVIVTPAPGQPGKMPFWHGDGPGRPLELGRAIGEFIREIRVEKDPIGRLRERHGLDELAAQNLIGYINEQFEVSGAVPDDRTIVVERFRDEIGDWRVCILTPFGAQVHAPWGMALQARLGEEWGTDIELMWRAFVRPRRDQRHHHQSPSQHLDVCVAIPRVFGPSIVVAAPSPRSAHPAVATTPAGRRSVVRCREVSVVSDAARGNPRVCQRCLRSPGVALGDD